MSNKVVVTFGSGAAAQRTWPLCPRSRPRMTNWSSAVFVSICHLVAHWPRGTLACKKHTVPPEGGQTRTAIKALYSIETLIFGDSKI